MNTKKKYFKCLHIKCRSIWRASRSFFELLLLIQNLNQIDIIFKTVMVIYQKTDTNLMPIINSCDKHSIISDINLISRVNFY